MVSKAVLLVAKIETGSILVCVQLVKSCSQDPSLDVLKYDLTES